MNDNANYQLTVVTAVRNLIEGGRSEMIRRCIESVARQKITGGVEQIIADGCSTDGTVELINKIIRTLPKRDGYCIKVFSKPDRQVFEGMNNGLAEAHGKYVIFLNSDDRFTGEIYLEKSLQLFDEQGADVGYADTWLEKPGVGHRRRQHSDINMLPFQCHFVHQSMVTKTSVIREFGGFDLSLKGTCLENDLTMKLVKAGKKFVRSPYCFCVYSLDGMTGRGTGERSQHPDMFLKHFGAELGLTLEECMGLRYFAGIGSWPEDKCRQVLSKLESRPEWASPWRDEINAVFKNGVRTKGSIVRRLRRRVDENGYAGLFRSVFRRLGKGGVE